VTLVNLNDAANTVTATTASDGSFTAQGLIPGDEYELRAAGDTARVKPIANGDHLGTLHLTGGGVNFKASIAPADAPTDLNCLYADASCDFTLIIENTGSANCASVTYHLDFEEGLVKVAAPNTPLLHGSLDAGARFTVPVTLRCEPFEAEYIFKKISITLTDDFTSKTFSDSVSLRFHKTPVTFSAASAHPVRGVIVTPTAQARRFSTQGQGAASSFTLPWSAQPYLAVFSGAALEAGSAYSFGVNRAPDTDFAGFSNPTKDEPNDTEDAATPFVSEGKVTSYLHKNDVDYYALNLDGCKLLAMTDYAFKDEAANTVSMVTSGASSFLDLTLTNNTLTAMNGVAVTLSSTSGYVTVMNGAAQIGTVSAGASNGTSGALQCAIAAACPMGTVLPFTLHFSNALGAAWTESIEVTTTAPAPANVQAAPLSNTSLAVSWNADGISGAEKYEVRYSTRNDVDMAQRVETTETSVTLTGLAANTTYSVWVRALCGAIAGASASASGRTLVDAPSAIAVSPAGARELRVTWPEVDGATGYDLYYSTTNDSAAATKESDVTIPYVIPDLNIGTTYYVWLKAKNALGESALSAGASGVPAPAAPTGINAVTLSDESIQVSWDSTDGASAYDLYYHTKNISSAAMKVSEVTSPHTLTGLSNGTTYYVWVKARHDTVVTDYSIGVDIITKPAAPDGVTAAAQSLSSKLILTWNAATGADTYTVYRAENGDGPFTTPIASGVAATSYTETSLMPETTYYYKVSAVNAGGEGALSAAANDTTWKVYEIGDTGPAGGIIFYVYPYGFTSNGVTCYYLEAAPADLESTYQWGGYGYRCSAGTAIGSGAANTAELAAHNHGSSTSGSAFHPAAQACADYEYGGYADWFLSSKNELNLMYTNLKQQGIGGFASTYYWSSSCVSMTYSGIDPSNAWCQHFISGAQDYFNYGGKNSEKSVRAARAF
jgi:hypothetical protein